MLFDVQALFSDAQAVTAAGPSDNIIDLGEPGKTWHDQTVDADIGKGTAKPIRIQVVTDFGTGAGMTDLTVTVQVDNDSGFGSPKNVAASTTPLAELVQGAVLNPIYVPRDVDERYMRLLYTPVGGDANAGALTAGIVSAHQDNQ